MILIKRRLAIGWLILLSLTVGFVVIAWLTLPTGEPFWNMARGAMGGIALMSPAIQYLRRTPADRARLRELKETDKQLDAIEEDAMRKWRQANGN